MRYLAIFSVYKPYAKYVSKFMDKDEKEFNLKKWCYKNIIDRYFFEKNDEAAREIIDNKKSSFENSEGIVKVIIEDAVKVKLTEKGIILEKLFPGRIFPEKILRM